MTKNVVNWRGNTYTRGLSVTGRQFHFSVSVNSRKTWYVSKSNFKLFVGSFCGWRGSNSIHLIQGLHASYYSHLSTCLSLNFYFFTLAIAFLSKRFLTRLRLLNNLWYQLMRYSVTFTGISNNEESSSIKVSTFFMKRLHTAAPKFTKRLFLHCWVDTKDQESTGAFTFLRILFLLLPVHRSQWKSRGIPLCK